METLQLHEIVGYLPYKLPVKVGLETIAILTTCINNQYSITLDNLLSNNTYKPILRSMSDLTQQELRQIIDHLFRDTKMIRPKMESVKFDKGFISFYDLDTRRTYVAVKPGHAELPVLNMSNTFNDYSIFFELHIDMFNLIGRGLAIDKNTLKD